MIFLDCNNRSAWQEHSGSRPRFSIFVIPSRWKISALHPCIWFFGLWCSNATCSHDFLAFVCSQIMEWTLEERCGMHTLKQAPSPTILSKGVNPYTQFCKKRTTRCKLSVLAWTKKKLQTTKPQNAVQISHWKMTYGRNRVFWEWGIPHYATAPPPWKHELFAS